MNKNNRYSAYFWSLCAHVAFFGILVFEIRFSSRSVGVNVGANRSIPVDVSDSSSSALKSGAKRLTSEKNEDFVSGISNSENPVLEKNSVENTGINSENTYFTELRRKILSEERYPLEARKRKLEDVIEVQFTVGLKGELIEISTNSAGKPAVLVEAARGSVERAAPFAPPPDHIIHRFTIPIEFKIK